MCTSDGTRGNARTDAHNVGMFRVRRSGRVIMFQYDISECPAVKYERTGGGCRGGVNTGVCVPPGVLKVEQRTSLLMNSLDDFPQSHPGKMWPWEIIHYDKCFLWAP